MKILILGASTKASIGYMVGELLRAEGHSVTYASRSGRLGARCDITSPPSVRALMRDVRPDVVIFAAGVFMTPKAVGKMRNLEKIAAHVNAKSVGSLIVCNQLARLKKRSYVIMLGGRETSSDPGFAAFTVGNGALWSLVRFLNAHTIINSYFIDLPFVEGSAMQKAFLKSADKRARHAAVDGMKPAKIASVVSRILSGKEKRLRIILGRGTS